VLVCTQETQNDPDPVPDEDVRCHRPLKLGHAEGYNTEVAMKIMMSALLLAVACGDEKESPRSPNP
jgi:hypothetical protein